MNVYAKTKEECFKFSNAKELFRELYNVCLLFKNTDHYYYCSCKKLRNQTIKCALCKFDDKFDDKLVEKYLITYRDNVEKLQEVVKIYWSFIQLIQKQNNSSLDFFNKEYVWSCRNYREGTISICELDEIIASNEEIISSNGVNYFLKHYI